MRSDFVAIILSHGRPTNVRTYNTIRKAGYTGDIIILCDNEDKLLDEYINIYGDQVVVFDKIEEAKKVDSMDNFHNRRCAVHARNACFDVAKAKGYKYFVELDDDYYCFEYRTEFGAICNKKMDEVVELFVEYLENTPQIYSIAFSQGGDHIGGYKPNKNIKRKCMNSWFCDVDRRFRFNGRMNDDVNAYIKLGNVGKVFLTIMNVQIDQEDTQSGGGMSGTYLDGGTYVKTFYSVMLCPSFVKVKGIGVSSKRLHHSISWKNAVPCVISEKYKKK